ncbi:MAG: carboxypeptidase regulatory-like domain-containing protein [Gemmatimonadales bacterium]
MRRFLGLVGRFALLSQPLLGQELRVRVADPGRNAPLSGALVRLETDSGVVARGITNDFARARLFAPAGSYRLVVERPGFADTTMQVTVPAVLDSLTVTHAARRPAFPNTLAAVPKVCEAPGMPDGVRPLWTEVDRTLRVVTATEVLGVLSMSLTAFDRTLSYEQRLEAQEVNSLLGGSNRAEVTASATELVRTGYLARGDSTRWLTPTVATFLSPEFLANHCFGTVNGIDNRAEYVGIRFLPVTTTTVQLTGTFWIDRSSRELKVIDYAFTPIDKSWRPERTGGSIEIHRMDPGFWVARFWYQRVPNLIRNRNGRERVETFREHGAEVVSATVVVDTTDRVAAARAFVQQQEEVRRRFASMEGLVVDSQGYAVPEVEVAMLGTEFQTTTDTTGRFVLRGLPLGLQVMRARKVGYKVQYFSARLVAGEEWTGKVLVARLPQILSEIVVVGKWGKPAKYANTGKYDAFYRRRAARSGRYLTREEIEKRPATRLSQLLAGMPGLRVGFDRPGGDEIEFATCPSNGVSMWVDGQRLSGTVGELLKVITASDIEAMEVYSRDSQIPAEFRDSACAAIVMWTR